MRMRPIPYGGLADDLQKGQVPNWPLTSAFPRLPMTLSCRVCLFYMFFYTQNNGCEARFVTLGSTSTGFLKQSHTVGVLFPRLLVAINTTGSKRSNWQ